MVSALVTVREHTDAAEARRVAAAMASKLDFDAAKASNLGIVVTEAAKNLFKHAGGGEVILRTLELDGACGVEALAIDKGPGINDLNRSREDGYSTAGTAGTGLGAIARLSDAHDIYSRPGQGTVLMAQVWNGGRVAASRYQVGVVCLPVAGEAECGDDWLFQASRDGARLMLADGLGHGPAAAQAAAAAVRATRERDHDSAPAAVEHIHGALRSTRGAAVAVARFDTIVVHVAGLGNIAGAIVSRSAPIRRMVTQPGIAGHEARRFSEFAYPWNRESLLVMHSDGLSTHWSLDAYPGLLVRSPSLIAGLLYRDYARKRDDVTVVVVKEAESA